jgi:hypothetical protein
MWWLDEGPPCDICGSRLLGRDRMCPNRYMRDHSDRARYRAHLIALCFMLADGRMTPTREDWEQAWGWVGEPPIAMLPFPG